MTSVLLRIRKQEADGYCRHVIVAVGFDARGRVVSVKRNKPRFYTRGGGWHAEELVLYRSRGVVSVAIFRVRGGRFLPIHPCSRCQRIAEKLGARILTGDKALKACGA